jgi:hypothetical protein
MVFTRALHDKRAGLGYFKDGSSTKDNASLARMV